MDELRRALKPLSLLLLLLLVPLGARAQDDPSPLPGVFGEVLDVRVVNLEVVVTDRQGIPVRGLRPVDFILKVDGDEVPIDYFSEIRGGTATVPESAEAREGIAERTASGWPTSRSSSAPPRISCRRFPS